MARHRVRKPAGPAAWTARVKVWLERDGSYGFGYGIAEILRAVDETGSIKHAAAAVSKSYRYVWSRIQQAERALGERLVETQVGGQGVHRSALTESARQLVRDFLAMRARMIEVMERECARRFGRAGRKRLRAVPQSIPGRGK